MWDQVSEDLQEKFLENNILPQPRKRVNGTGIQKLHPVTKEVMKSYLSVKDAIMEHKMSRQTLFSIIENEAIKYDAIWRYSMD